MAQITASDVAGVFSRVPDWSPDCTEIAFQSNRDDLDNLDIYVMRADGTNMRRLTGGAGPEESPAWSPDGRRIAFASGSGQDEAIWMVDVDGTNLRRVTDGPAFQPAWSPDGRHIVYISGTSDNWDIFVAGVDGSEPRNLTNTADRHEGGPAFSIGGEEILFDALRDGHWEIYLMSADGIERRQLTDNVAMDARPAWSPDGTEIVFHSTRAFGSDGDIEDFDQVELYTMRSDGSSVHRLTDNAFMDAHPDWCAVVPQ